MGFVKNHCGIVGQHIAIGAVSERQVGEEQMMIDHYNVGLLGPISHAGNEAGIEVRAFLTYTRVGPCVDVAPERKMLRKTRQLRAVAGRGFSRPTRHILKVVNFIKAVENRRALSTIESLQTDVVIPS